MKKSINVFGIKTNNLKNIDITLTRNAINLIIGPSGSGKSSLAYETIAQIAQYEFMSMFADNILEPTYRVREYENMIPAVPIKQSNFNNNAYSTIGTYFGINRNVALIYAALLDLDESFFVLNKESNLCNNCHGLGHVKFLDKNRIVNYDIPIGKNPFRCWNRYVEFYSHIIQQFCASSGINFEKTFRQLSERERELLLFGESQNKFSVRYKKLNSISQRTTKYYGVMTSKPMMPNFSPANHFFSNQECSFCNGKKYSKEHDNFKLYDISIGEFMTMPFVDLKRHIEKIMPRFEENGLMSSMQNIYRFASTAVELNLNYLFFHRSIPSLSGGELQRLRMIQVFNNQLEDFMIVLDEPLAGLHSSERHAIRKSIINLIPKHTLLIVDHGDTFSGVAQNIIALGEGSGIEGGNIIDVNQYLNRQCVKKDFLIAPPSHMLKILLTNRIYHYCGVSLDIGISCMNLITGRSGVGKSTLLREYFSQYFENYIYVNQKPLVGNKNSTIATAIGVSVRISEVFAKNHHKDKRFFSNQTGCDGACSVCLGAGYLEYANGNETKLQLECRECGGTGFNKRLLNYKVSGKNIFNIWNMTIKEAIEFFQDIDKKITKELECAPQLLLSHLKIGQPISSLSGGENIRVKILKSTNSSAKILGIDEPFKGLSNSEIFHVAQHLEKLRSQGKTIIVADHSEAIKQYFACKFELIVSDENILTGI